MGFEDKPTASVSVDKSGDGWLVKTYNLGGEDLQEKFFHSKAEADAFAQGQYEKIRNQM